ncbi:MAG: hypothetical protein RLZZ213_568, partial [Cyanobacteriota bacterium]
MVRMGVGRMVMAVTVVVAETVVVAVPRGVVVIVGVAAHWNRHAIGLAGTGALAL